MRRRFSYLISKIDNNPAPLVWSLIVGITVLRLAYALFVMTPMSGPDAPAYDAAARAIAHGGILAPHVPSIPLFPVGYPILLSGFYALFGTARAATAAQVLLLAPGTFVAFKLVEREFGRRPAFLTVLLLCFSPALFAAPGQLMYETPMAVGLIVGIDLLSRARRSESGLSLAVGGAGVLALASIMQPKLVAPALLVTVWAMWGKRSLLSLGLCVVIVLLGPLALALRNEWAIGEFVVAQNLGSTMAAGMHDGATGGWGSLPESCSALPGEDPLSVRCSVAWAQQNPSTAAWLALKKASYFFSPLVGADDYRSTWFHAFDYRRLLPGSIRDASWFLRIHRAALNVWTVLLILLVGAGMVLALRTTRRRAGGVLFCIPLLAFLAISMVTTGDARMRVPVAPFYSAFIALALLELADRFKWLSANTEGVSGAPGGSN